jgi:hypothetical protein
MAATVEHIVPPNALATASKREFGLALGGARRPRQLRGAVLSAAEGWAQIKRQLAVDAPLADMKARFDSMALHNVHYRA